MTHTICINAEKYQVALSHTTILSDILLRHTAYITNVPSIYSDNRLLWILLNEEKVVNAFTYIIGHDPPHSVISIEYAMLSSYFQRCVDIMQKNGIYISDVNIGLLVFTLFSWMKQEATSDVHYTAHMIQEKALTMMHCYPEHFSQPVAFTHTYYEIIHCAKKEKTLNIHKALK